VRGVQTASACHRRGWRVRTELSQMYQLRFRLYSNHDRPPTADCGGPRIDGISQAPAGKLPFAPVGRSCSPRIAGLHRANRLDMFRPEVFARVGHVSRPGARWNSTCRPMESVGHIRSRGPGERVAKGCSQPRALEVFPPAWTDGHHIASAPAPPASC